MIIIAEEFKLLSVKTAIYRNSFLTHAIELVSMELCEGSHRQVVTSRKDIVHAWWRLNWRTFKRLWWLHLLNALLINIKVLNLVINIHASHVYIRDIALVREIRVVISRVIGSQRWNAAKILRSDESGVWGISRTTSSADLSAVYWIKIHDLVVVRILSCQLLLHRHGVELLELIYSTKRSTIIYSWLIRLILLLLVLELLLVM